ncbi:hypothetical protein, partial [Paraburkholderia humisilvae]|uniref:hypothetical protein n=1 Tax=Paraburkholderia humisilvae TaxID=627669 RepID=UPI0035ED0371
STDLRSSPRAGFRQPCGDVMIYGKVNKLFRYAPRLIAIDIVCMALIDRTGSRFMPLLAPSLESAFRNITNGRTVEWASSTPCSAIISSGPR